MLAAMRDELKRSMSGLRLTGEPAPYYIDYTVEDASTLQVTARLGALLDDTIGRDRTLEVDVRTFDSSLGGLGGCPFAPGATGNIVTEDLVFMLEAMGLRTGIDLDQLLAIRKIVAEGIPGEPLYGYVPDAGVTKGFVPASRT